MPTEQPPPPDAPGVFAEANCLPANYAEPRVFNIVFSTDTQDELLAAILADHTEAAEARIVVTANLDHIVTLQSDAAFRSAYHGAWKVTADGAPVYLYARARGANLRERVTGSDLFAALVDCWRPGADRLFLIVSTEQTAENITRQLVKRGFADSDVAVAVPPFGFERDLSYDTALCTRIAAFGPTHLVMGVGAPKSEIWAHRHRHALAGIVVLCVGASIEFVTGEKRRAPVALRRIGMEWAWRFAIEPRRLFTRYFVRSFGFFRAIIKDQRHRAPRL